MSVLSVQTKKIPELPTSANLSNDDLLIVELADGGTRKMTYGDLFAVVQASLKGDEDAMLTVASITDVQSKDEGKVPAAALVAGMADLASIMYREQKAAYGYFGIEQNLDTLMTYVRKGEWDKFAIGDYFIDTRTNGQKVMWEVADKNGYLHCGDTSLEKNNIICVPRDCLEETQQYNSSNTNTGGFAGSLMPAKLEAIANTFSSKLQSYMTSVRRLENNKNAWAWASRRIMLPSVTEMLGHQGWADTWSGGPVNHSLALFTGGNAHVMKGRGFNKIAETRTWYWLEDPSAANTANFCFVSSYGNSSYSGASYAVGLAPLIVLS